MAGRRVSVVMALLAGVAGAGLPGVASAQEREVYQFDLPAQDLGDALRAVAARAGWELYASADEINGVAAPRLQGSLTARQAIEQLLAGTDLSVRFAKGAVIIRGRSQTVETTAETENKSDIVVTGSRIRGAPPAAPVISITGEDIRNAGQSDLGEVARSLPQNFGGGQNPGIGSTQGAPNQNTNVNGASTFNLRGIGPNATLTLLNGNRLSYSGISAAVDASSIPAAAVDRVEIIADGASAIYGADAVAGVVNIILKKEYSGLYTSARIGASTDGGNFQQQYDAVGGSRWDGGGFLATYDFFRNGAIKASDRSYTGAANPSSTIYPEIARHSFLLSAHQQAASWATLSADFIFKSGEMNSANGYLIGRPVDYQGIRVRRKFETIGFAPTANFDLPSRWSASLTGFYGVDNTDGLSRVYSGGNLSSTPIAQYKNRSLSLETSFQGPLLTLPGGDARLAVGAGIRSYHFTNDVPGLYLSKTRKNYFAYAEAFVPLIGAAQDVRLIRSLSLSGAIRLEDYSDSDHIITPKVGAIYEPVDGLKFKASWGRSFKLPTLYQQYSGYATVLYPVTGYGNAFPSNATFIAALGANDKDKAERSENLTLTTEASPLEGLTLSASYFHIKYVDRVAAPLATSTGALTNPLYVDLITFNPTIADQNAITSGAYLGGLQNATGAPYNPSTVVAILDARDRNVARQWYEGADFSARYRLMLSTGDSIALTGAATWLRSKQQLLPGQPTTDLAGQIFYPPHFKARGGTTYRRNDASISAFVNYVGGVTDARRATSASVASFTTLDLTGRAVVWAGFEVSMNIINLFNAKPATIYTSTPSDTPFDTTNYSAVGRFVGFGISRKW